jgi:hypothetical protein
MIMMVMMMQILMTVLVMDIITPLVVVIVVMILLIWTLQTQLFVGKLKKRGFTPDFYSSPKSVSSPSTVLSDFPSHRNMNIVRWLCDIPERATSCQVLFVFRFSYERTEVLCAMFFISDHNVRNICVKTGENRAD